MKGIELAERYYYEYGESMLKERFANLLPIISVGISGGGSDCLGYDDGISEDHDFEPGFCIFLPDEEALSRRDEFELERAYASLPKEFMGYKRSPISPVGGNRHGVMRISDFFLAKTGTPDGVLSAEAWLGLPEQALLEATSGKIFYDGSGHMSAIRKQLEYFPEDVRLKKLAGELLMMCQSGQYNYQRCVSRGERGAAQMALYEFVKSAMHTVFLLNRKYMPYYKWSFRALRELSFLSELEEPLEFLISSANTDAEFEKKSGTIELVCESIAKELVSAGISRATENNMEALAYEVNGIIGDERIRNLHILYAI